MELDRPHGGHGHLSLRKLDLVVDLWRPRGFLSSLFINHNLLNIHECALIKHSCVQCLAELSNIRVDQWVWSSAALLSGFQTIFVASQQEGSWLDTRLSACSPGSQSKDAIDDELRLAAANCDSDFWDSCRCCLMKSKRSEFTCTSVGKLSIAHWPNHFRLKSA